MRRPSAAATASMSDCALPDAVWPGSRAPSAAASATPATEREHHHDGDDRDAPLGAATPARAPAARRRRRAVPGSSPRRERCSRRGARRTTRRRSRRSSCSSSRSSSDCMQEVALLLEFLAASSVMRSHPRSARRRRPLVGVGGVQPRLAPVARQREPDARGAEREHEDGQHPHDEAEARALGLTAGSTRRTGRRSSGGSPASLCPVGDPSLGCRRGSPSTWARCCRRPTALGTRGTCSSAAIECARSARVGLTARPHQDREDADDDEHAERDPGPHAASHPLRRARVEHRLETRRRSSRSSW